MSNPEGALQGIRVLDLTDNFGSYGGRLLAGLGAEVIRVHDQGTAEHPPLPPLVDSGGKVISFYDRFVHAGKKSVSIDLGTAEGREVLRRLVEAADVVLSAGNGREPGGWNDVNPRLVHVVVTPFGWGRSPSAEPVDDLIVLGAGGLLNLGGYSDIGPIAPFGGQSSIASGIFAAVAALVGLIEREQTGSGNSADVSAQEAIAQALEDSLPAYVLTGEIRAAQGEDAREAGSGVYACADGYVSMIAGRLGTARAWTALVAWLNESGLTDSVPGAGAVELMEPQWSQFRFRQTPEASERFRQTFEAFASTRTKEVLYVEAQRRGIALSPVSNVGDLLGNQQLQARSFFTAFFDEELGMDLVSPGAPYRMSESKTIDLGAAVRPGSDTESVLAELGIKVPDLGAGPGISEGEPA